MILVLLGTQKHQFTRLLEALETALIDGKINQTILAQNGHTNFKSKHMKLIGFVDQSELDTLIQEADFVICHGGAGSIFKCLEYGKKVIAVARSSLFDEHFNDHQVDIVQQLSDLGYILAVGELKNLAHALNQVTSFVPKPFFSNTESIIEKIRSYIEEQI